MRNVIALAAVAAFPLVWGTSSVDFWLDEAPTVDEQHEEEYLRYLQASNTTDNGTDNGTAGGGMGGNGTDGNGTGPTAAPSTGAGSTAAPSTGAGSTAAASTAAASTGASAGNGTQEGAGSTAGATSGASSQEGGGEGSTAAPSSSATSAPTYQNSSDNVSVNFPLPPFPTGMNSTQLDAMITHMTTSTAFKTAIENEVKAQIAAQFANVPGVTTAQASGWVAEVTITVCCSDAACESTYNKPLCSAVRLRFLEEQNPFLDVSERTVRQLTTTGLEVKVQFKLQIPGDVIASAGAAMATAYQQREAAMAASGGAISNVAAVLKTQLTAAAEDPAIGGQAAGTWTPTMPTPVLVLVEEVAGIVPGTTAGAEVNSTAAATPAPGSSSSGAYSAHGSAVLGAVFAAFVGTML